MKAKEIEFTKLLRAKDLELENQVDIGRVVLCLETELMPWLLQRKQLKAEMRQQDVEFRSKQRLARQLIESKETEVEALRERVRTLQEVGPSQL